MGPVSEYLVVAGMSGAGRSSAAANLEDAGWFVIDNLPPALIGKVAELVEQRGSELNRIALVIGRGGRDSLVELQSAIAGLRSIGAFVRILFLDASDEVLVRRYEGTRRRHPMDDDAAGVMAAIGQERELLRPLAADADVVIDTGEMNVHQLRDRLVELFASRSAAEGMALSIISFGYKHGLPLDADLVFDCRFLPNPHWVAELRPLSGLDEPVRAFVLTQTETKEFLERIDDLLLFLLPAYAAEGKSYLSVALGCTGGRHRSVALAEELARRLRRQGHSPAVHHRDLDR
jgi:RNase adapter protein RapZ